jgi:hypothetical protein
MGQSGERIGVRAYRRMQLAQRSAYAETPIRRHDSPCRSPKTAADPLKYQLTTPLASHNVRPIPSRVAEGLAL